MMLIRLALLNERTKFDSMLRYLNTKDFDLLPSYPPRRGTTSGLLI